MDSIISRMMRLIAFVFVAGFVWSAMITANLKDWGDCMAFLIFGSLYAVVVTITWTLFNRNILDQLAGRRRSEITRESIIGLSIAGLALILCAGFVSAGISSANGKDNGYSLEFLIFGGVLSVILEIIWCIAEFYFVRKKS